MEVKSFSHGQFKVLVCDKENIANHFYVVDKSCDHKSFNRIVPLAYIKMPSVTGELAFIIRQPHYRSLENADSLKSTILKEVTKSSADVPSRAIFKTPS